MAWVTQAVKSSQYKTQILNTIQLIWKNLFLDSLRWRRCCPRFEIRSQRPTASALFLNILWNKALTLASNAETNVNLTALETCYIAFRRDTVADLLIEEDRFDCEREFTVKVAQAGIQIFKWESPTSEEPMRKSKKIGWKDRFWASRCIVQYQVRNSARGRYRNVQKSPSAKKTLWSLASPSLTDRNYS